MQGTGPGEAGYRAPRLTYQLINGGAQKVAFPPLDFTVETAAGKLFHRRFELPPGSAFVEPGPPIDRAISLDPTFETDWSDLYKKADKARFTWSIEGQGNGEAEKPVHKAWP